jgi:hypothetical protein
MHTDLAISKECARLCFSDQRHRRSIRLYPDGRREYTLDGRLVSASTFKLLPPGEEMVERLRTLTPRIQATFNSGLSTAVWWGTMRAHWALVQGKDISSMPVAVDPATGPRPRVLAGCTG